MVNRWYSAEKADPSTLSWQYYVWTTIWLSIKSVNNVDKCWSNNPQQTKEPKRTRIQKPIIHVSWIRISSSHRLKEYSLTQNSLKELKRWIIELFLASSHQILLRREISEKWRQQRRWRHSHFWTIYHLVRHWTHRTWPMLNVFKFSARAPTFSNDGGLSFKYK